MLEKNPAADTPRETEVARPTPRARSRRRPWKRIVALVVVAGLAGAAWYYYGRPRTEAAPATVAVTRGDIQQTVLASGTLEANSVVSVGAEVSGRIESLAVKLGDKVRKGDLIARIDSLDQENAVKSFEAALANMQAQLRAQQASLDQTKAALQRARDLAAKTLVSQADLQTAQANYDAAAARVDQIEAQITQARLAVDSANLDLSRTKITAPADGTVVAVLVSEGQTVNAQQTSPTIVKLADLDTMVIKAQISEADVTRVQPGQQVYFTILGEPDRKIDATLRAIEPAPDAITTSDTGLAGTGSAVYYNGLFEVPNPDHRLRIAMTAQVTIVLADEPDALLIPASALGGQGRNGAYEVTVYDPATRQTTRKRIEVGIDNNVMASVERGLTEGELVVTSARAAAGSTGAPTSNGGTRRFPSPLGF